MYMNKSACFCCIMNHSCSGISDITVVYVAVSEACSVQDNMLSAGLYRNSSVSKSLYIHWNVTNSACSNSG